MQCHLLDDGDAQDPTLSYGHNRSRCREHCNSDVINVPRTSFGDECFLRILQYSNTS